MQKSTIHPVISVMRLALIGLPGAGKTSQADLLSQHLAIPVVSIRSHLKSIAASGTELGDRILSHWHSSASWQPLPDELMLKAVDSVPQLQKSSWILEGFPRNAEQAKWLLRLPPHLRPQIIWLDISIQQSAMRLSQRGRTGETAEARLLVEQERFMDLVMTFKHGFGVIKVEASEPIGDVTKNILRYFEDDPDTVPF